MGAMAAGAATGDRTAVQGGIRLGNLYFSSGLTGVRPEARKDLLAFGGDIKEQTHTILKAHKANLESMGSSLEKVLKVTVFLADVKTEKSAMNEVMRNIFPTRRQHDRRWECSFRIPPPASKSKWWPGFPRPPIRTNSHWRISDARL